MPQLPIHFFTIVLNGEPFIRYHIEMLRRLNVPWHWHIIEGAAELKHDTGWSVSNGGQLQRTYHNNGLSNDGTRQYLDKLKSENSQNITIYRKGDGKLWDGKKEMVSQPLPNIREEALLWQLDSDEIWSTEQIEKMHQMFISEPQRFSAYFWCWYFVSPKQIISSRNCYAQNPNSEWLRVWRYHPGMLWISHEPPVLALKGSDGNFYNVGQIAPFRHLETEAAGLLFEHYSYVTEEQVEFKQSYYGYAGAVESWRRLQKAPPTNVKLRDYFSWVKDDTEVSDASLYSLTPHAKLDQTIGRWIFDHKAKEKKSTAARHTVIIDGVFFQIARSGIARLWSSILEIWSKSPFADRLLILDRDGTAPKFQGLRYRMTPTYIIGNMSWDRLMLQQICDEEDAALFVSTYYTRPEKTPSFQLVYDMIPEVMNYDLNNDPRWLEKQLAFKHASSFACISEHTKRDLLKTHPKLNKENIPVIYPAYDKNIFHPASSNEILTFFQKYQITHPYFILVGPAKGYKNVELFFDGMRALSTQYGFEALLVGGDVSDADLESFRAGCQVHRLKLHDAELAAAYSGAVALVYPSRYEGFGLPILEAMSCGCPVITTPFSSIPEVGGDAVIYVQNSSELTEALCEVQKPSVRQKLHNAAKQQLSKFSWVKTAEDMAKYIETAAHTHLPVYYKEMSYKQF